MVGNEFDVYWETAGYFMDAVAIFVTESHFHPVAWWEPLDLPDGI